MNGRRTVISLAGDWNLTVLRRIVSRKLRGNVDAEGMLGKELRLARFVDSRKGPYPVALRKRLTGLDSTDSVGEETLMSFGFDFFSLR